MPVPKKKRSVSRRGSRHGAPEYKLTTHTVVRCNNCDAPTLLHHMCNSCGYYHGNEILVVKKEEDQ